MEIAEGGGLDMPKKIPVRIVVGEKYDRIVGYALGPMPELSPAWNEVDWEEVPY